ncbi:glycoside hydrolase family 3 protein [Actinomadura barringtoniae]|uniref:glycoside hydrolase family 3 protein n=1 Tax=Actinomadura barringtoniae TaxID=1427535 RepID=UPI0027DBB21D|nr:glycoside hydrolase family 3 protein [Actinomadura barringtoniae]
MLPLASCGGDPAKAGSSAKPSASKPGKASAAPGTRKADWIPGYVADMSLPEKVGQLFVPTFSSESAAKEAIKKYHVGGLIYFPGNMHSPKQTAEQSNALQKTSKVPLLLGVDEEQGIVSRAPFITSFPGNMALGATHDPAQARAAAQVTGTELRAVGINQNYAPVADVNVNPHNPVIGVRSFGSDPAQVSTMLGGAIAGYQAAGVAATAKHFPGHGDTGTDSHTGLPVIKHSRTTWERLDAPPFKAAIADGVDSIMSAHIVVPGLDKSGDPSTLSPTVLTGLLRGTLGFQGVIITDSLEMAGARRKYPDTVVPVRAVNAGADQLLMPPSLSRAHAAVVKAVHSGKISEKRLDDAVARVLRLKEKRGLFSGTHVDPARADKVVGSAGNKATVRQVAEHAVTLVRNEGVLPLAKKTVYVSGPKSAPLAAALREHGVHTTASLHSADAAVLTTLNAGSATAARVKALKGKPVVVAALGRPYDLNSADQAKGALATYSSSSASVAALAKALSGDLKPTGKLPVPAGGKPAGHGLTYG